MGLVLPVLLLSMARSGSHAFNPFTPLGKSISHRQITETAILLKTTEVCRAVATAEGRNFTEPTGDRLTVSTVQRACFPGDGSFLSGAQFKAVVMAVCMSNAAVDALYFLNDPRHFDGESFMDGRSLITEGVASVKASVRQESFFSARLTLGTISHTLQDFYSHSNWIELGNKRPNTNLLRADQPMSNLADEDTPTCRSCIGGSCKDNILPEILQEGKLTSGYFSLNSAFKPAGKCSHGGRLDRTSTRDPEGGINKDSLRSEHGHLHCAAATMATHATLELLEDVRGAAGEIHFLRLMGVARPSVLCLVIGSTGSMREELAEVKRVTFSIVDREKSLRDEPSVYILVPFNDPGFGPLIRTTDSNFFKERVNDLTARGGGDRPEMCLSALQLALSRAPRSSEIFVFTDAPAKDAHLKNRVSALIESTKSVVTFFLTNALSARRRRNSDGLRTAGNARNAGNGLYQELAEASGGQAIVVTKTALPRVTRIIEDSSTSALVTLLQAVRNPGSPDNFTFIVDPSVRNLTAYLTGTSLTFSVSRPSGVSQNSSVTDGPLGRIQVAGNLHTLQLNTQTGLWEISVSSAQPYSLKVTGRSGTDFVYGLLETLLGPGTDYTLKEGRPQAGEKAVLLLSVVGGHSPVVTEVLLVEASGSRAESGGVKALGDGDYLVSVERVPEGQFVVLVKGTDGKGARAVAFQRQSLTRLRGSGVAVVALANGTIEPGVPFSLPFTVTAKGASGNYTISARDDRGFTYFFTPSLVLESGTSAGGSVELSAPAGTPSGTEVTLTIEAEAPGATDSNYALLRLTVVTKVTDFTRPLCQVVSVSANCSEDCSQSEWGLSANMTDGNGTGILSVTARRGNGTLNASASAGAAGLNVTTVTYSASCCSPDVELVVVDTVGNVGTCFHSVRSAPGTEPPAASSPALPRPALPRPAPGTTEAITASTPSSASALRPPLLLVPTSLLLAMVRA